MSDPLVSVLMTAYNREKYIGHAIESVLSSTYENFELIVVDDESRDRTVDIVQQLARQDQRVRLHINAKNLGDYPNRNQAASLASGTYLKYVDADDLLYPHALEMLVRSMEQSPGAGFGLRRSPSNLVPYPTRIEPADIYREHFFGGPRWHNSPLSAIIRREAFEAVGGFSGRRHVGDMEMWLRLGARFPAVKLPGGFAFWRSHEDQENKRRKNRLAEDALLRYNVQIDVLQEVHCPLPPDERQAAIDVTRHRLVREAFRRLRQGKLDVAGRIFQKSDLTWSDFAKAFPRPARAKG